MEIRFSLKQKSKIIYKPFGVLHANKWLLDDLKMCHENDFNTLSLFVKGTLKGYLEKIYNIN